VLTERAARQHQRRHRPDQRECPGDDEGRVEAAGCGDDMAGHDRGQQTEGIAAEDEKGKSPPRIAGRAQQVADQGPVGGRPDMGGRYRDRDQGDDRSQGLDKRDQQARGRKEQAERHQIAALATAHRLGG
jgi:hypothetical protein